jgi:hypothetical protein
MIALLHTLSRIAGYMRRLWTVFVTVAVAGVVALREWFQDAVQQGWLILNGYLWALVDSLGITDYFESFNQIAQILGDYAWFGVWAIPVVPVFGITMGAYLIAGYITLIRHTVGALWFNPG